MLWHGDEAVMRVEADCGVIDRVHHDEPGGGGFASTGSSRARRRGTVAAAPSWEPRPRQPPWVSRRAADATRERAGRWARATAPLRYHGAMATIQIREIPEEAYEVIRRRARMAGRSIQSYMCEWVVDFASQPTTDEVLAALEGALADHATPGATRASVLGDLDADRR